MKMEFELQDVVAIDGDTVEATLKLGFDIYMRKRIRLYGINCAEVHSSNADEKAKGLDVKIWLHDQVSNGEKILFRQSKHVEKYGRLMGELKVDGVCMNDKLIELGYAKPYFGEKK